MIAADVAYALVLGGCLSLGILLVLAATPRWRARGLSARIAPYLRDVVDLAPIVHPAQALGRLRVPRLGAGMSSWLRSRELVWLLVGVVCGAAASMVVVAAGGNAATLAVLPIVGGIAGAIAHRSRVNTLAERRRRRIDEELPVVLEFLALCLSAGEGLLDSLRRVGERGTGELAGELRVVAVDVGTGTALPQALGALTRRVPSAALARAVDQLVAAIERGTPLADILHAHAADARGEAQRALTEQAGRKEVAMLVPLVFLILPISVLFAIFPGVVLLRLS